MGAKTWMLVYSIANAADTLKAGVNLDRAATDALISKLFPNENLEADKDECLAYTNPPENKIYAGCFGDVSVLAAREFAIECPSTLEPHFIDASIGNNIYLHAMHSVVDWLSFAKWSNGKLVRALSLSPDTGIVEVIGDKLDFEMEYWQGKHPALDPEMIPLCGYRRIKEKPWWKFW